MHCLRLSPLFQSLLHDNLFDGLVLLNSLHPLLFHLSDSLDLSAPLESGLNRHVLLLQLHDVLFLHLGLELVVAFLGDGRTQASLDVLAFDLFHVVGEEVDVFLVVRFGRDDLSADWCFGSESVLGVFGSPGLGVVEPVVAVSLLRSLQSLVAVFHFRDGGLLLHLLHLSLDYLVVHGVAGTRLE